MWVWGSEAEQLWRVQRRPEREAVQQGKQLRSLPGSAVCEPHKVVPSRQPLRGGHSHRFLSSQFRPFLRLRRLVQLPKGAFGTISCGLHRDCRNQSRDNTCAVQEGQVWAERRGEIQLERELPLLSGLDKQCGTRWGSGGSESEGAYNGLDSNGPKLGTELALLTRSHRTVSFFRSYSHRRQNHCLLRRGSPLLALWNDLPRKAVPFVTTSPLFLSLYKVMIHFRWSNTICGLYHDF